MEVQRKWIKFLTGSLILASGIYSSFFSGTSRDYKKHFTQAKKNLEIKTKADTTRLQEQKNDEQGSTNIAESKSMPDRGPSSLGQKEVQEQLLKKDSFNQLKNDNKLSQNEPISDQLEVSDQENQDGTSANFLKNLTKEEIELKHKQSNFKVFGTPSNDKKKKLSNKPSKIKKDNSHYNRYDEPSSEVMNNDQGNSALIVSGGFFAVNRLPAENDESFTSSGTLTTSTSLFNSAGSFASGGVSQVQEQTVSDTPLCHLIESDREFIRFNLTGVENIKSQTYEFQLCEKEKKSCKEADFKKVDTTLELNEVTYWTQLDLMSPHTFRLKSKINKAIAEENLEVICSTFFNQKSVPASPVKVTVLNKNMNSTTNTNSIQIKWRDNSYIENIQQLKICLDRECLFIYQEIDLSANVETYTLSNLEAETQYYIFIRSGLEQSFSEWLLLGEFTTLSNP